MPFITLHNGSADDQALIRLYKTTGEIKYAGELFEKYMTFIYGVCLRYFTEEPAKDAAMQVFEILADKLQQHEVQNFKSWLHVLTRNHCLMIRRTAKRKEGSLSSFDEAHIMEKDDFDHHAVNATGGNGSAPEEDLQAMEKCMETLPAEQRRSIDLFYLKEKSYREIVSQTGYELKKVKSYIQNGKRNLKICMEKEKEKHA